MIIHTGFRYKENSILTSFTLSFDHNLKKPKSFSWAPSETLKNHEFQENINI